MALGRPEPVDLIGLATKAVEALGLIFAIRLSQRMRPVRIAHPKEAQPMSSNPTAGRRMTLALAGLIAVASATLVLAVSGTHEGHADTGHSHADAVAVSAKTNAKQAVFHDAMRKLWEDHVTWTRLAIISLAHWT